MPSASKMESRNNPRASTTFEHHRKSIDNSLEYRQSSIINKPEQTIHRSQLAHYLHQHDPTFPTLKQKRTRLNNSLVMQSQNP